jgi:hypothetical protein
LKINESSYSVSHHKAIKKKALEYSGEHNTIKGRNKMGEFWGQYRENSRGIPVN